MSIRTKIFALITLLSNLVYIVWLFFNYISIWGLIFFVAELLIFSLTLIFVINHWDQRHVHSIKAPAKGSLDVFLPVYNEPVSIYQQTLEAASKIDYENKKIYILDDGPREELKELASKYGATYLSRDSRKDRKAGNLNHALSKSDGEFVLVLDADQKVEPNIAKDLLGYFQQDDKLSIVTTRQRFDIGEKDFNNDILFYQHMQTGKNADNAAISCGSGVFYRRTNLVNIGGFQVWNIVEDLYTSYIFHKNGYKTLYINKPYTTGLAPNDLYNIYRQRGGWSLDTLRMFFWKSPIFSKGLKLRQRLHYFELAWAYIVAALALPILFTWPAISMYLNLEIVTDGFMYAVLRLPTIVLIISFYYFLSNRTFQVSQFWAGLFVVYLQSFVLALFPFVIKYEVTDKIAGPNRRDVALVLPHILLILVSLGVVVWRIFFVDFGILPQTALGVLWIFIMAFWFAPIIRKSFILE